MNKNVTDMTVGSPTRHIFRFALPLLIGNVFQQFYNIIDSFVVGNYVGADALAAVGTCGSMNFLFFSLSSGLAIGIGIIAAQFFGASDEKNVRTTIANSISVLGIASVAVSILGFSLCPFILKMIQCPDSIINLSITYMRTTCLGIIFIAFYNGVASILRALGDSKTPLYFLILSSIVNLILDLIFVLIFNWFVFGVALATVIAQGISAVTSAIYAYHKVSYFRLNKNELHPQTRIIASSFKLGIPIAMQNSLIAISMLVLQGVVNTFGEQVMATYTIVMRVEQLVQQSFSFLGSSITNYSGQNKGAGKIDRVKNRFYQGTVIVLLFSIFVLPIAFFLGEKNNRFIY